MMILFRNLAMIGVLVSGLAVVESGPALGDSEAAQSARDAQIERNVRSIRRQQLGDPSGAPRRLNRVRRDLIRNENGVNFDAGATRRSRELRSLDREVERRSRLEIRDDDAPRIPRSDQALPSSLAPERSPLPSMRSQVDRLGSMVRRAEGAVADGRIRQGRSDLEFSRSFLTRVDPSNLDEDQREALEDYRARIEELDSTIGPP